MKKIRSLGIHDGTFHADEVTACALLLVFDQIDEDKIVRTRDKSKLLKCEFVCDVGGEYDPKKKLFDHHQASYKGNLSSAGMILNYLKEIGVISRDEFHFFNTSLIIGVDAHDNGLYEPTVGQCTFSHVVANYNPSSYDPTEEELNNAFYEALRFVIGHLQRMHERFIYNNACKLIVKTAMDRDKICLFFERGISWLEGFFALGGKDHPALFVIMPAKEHWKLRCVPPDYEHRMRVRLPLPEEWAGLLGNELKLVSGIEGAVFCHKGRFTSVWETRQDALRALKLVLNRNGIPYENTF